MDILKQLNDAVGYIENNLCNEIDSDLVAEIACVNKDSFMRFFSYMTNMTLNEYIRCRKLTLAAYELQNTKLNIIDIAIKYGWGNADSFTKAFVRQHGITPTLARNPYVSLKIYPPVSFTVIVKGAYEMDMRIMELGETQVYGISKQFDGKGYETREELRHIMWSENCEDVPGVICKGHWNQPQNHSYDGIWYGLWKDGNYTIAKSDTDTAKNTLEKHTIPSGRYAAFKTKPGGLAWEEFPNLFDLIFNAWLPSSEYILCNNLIIEIYHLWTDKEMRNKNRYYEVLIPVKKK